ncbi:Gfo/Idh/MocA family protein [Roseibium sediminicola]|uniref:Gfo/Idh/MocA family oxidoreductase n=1 Tax=Roseibium sediminicola TaxID=2933272 RepID=A0ABT0GR74_9HYPH|nr:Gfo/Idh/MocA family oxidoreductase [Roseibium sp. CAU 1639]MCK7611562.1 Gfo/Idh/MocA family oxidoreductase [Roseibium sp. CAU 1639]
MKTGYVGLGARIAHVSNCLQNVAGDIDPRAYVDPTPAGLKQVEARSGSTLAAYDDLASMLQREKLDLLMIGSPNFMHLDHLRTALESDVKYIFCEKPVVTTEAETFELLSLMKAHGGEKRVIVGLVLRYSPLYTELQKSLKAGQIGKVVSIEAAEHIGPYHGSFFMRDWRRYEKNSGGFMLEKCCHDLDLYQGVTGCRPRYVSSFGGRKSFVPDNRPDQDHSFPTPVYKDRVDPFTPRWGGGNADFDSDGDIIDYQTALIEYEDGANLCFHTNLYVPDEFRRFAVMGTKGMAEGDFIRNYFRVHDALTSACLIDRPKLVDAGRDGHYGADDAMARDLTHYFRNGGGLPVGVLDALEAGLTAIKLDEARRARAVLDLSDTWQQFDSYGLA